jgi:L-alanine-DL-glutamate epimerase-like enolase superfamily enzyme
MDVGLERRTLAFRAPLRTAYGELRTRELIELTLRGADGVEGRGEAAPLEPYDGVPIDAVMAVLELYRPLLEDGDDVPGPQLYDACRARADCPEALAAVDLALWDRAGRRAGEPVCRLLTDAPAAAVEINATIAATDRAGAAREAAEAVRAGYRCLKLKVGVGDDAGRVAAVRAAAGPTVALRLDANGAWSVEEAVRAIEALAPAGLELVEEPVHGAAAFRELRGRVAVRIAADESGLLDCADAVALKVSRCGGIGGVLAAAALVRAQGAEPYLSSTYDGPLGIAAALHCAAALAPLPPCGLATAELFAGEEPAFPVRDGAIVVPTAPGLMA